MGAENRIGRYRVVRFLHKSGYERGLGFYTLHCIADIIVSKWDWGYVIL